MKEASFSLAEAAYSAGDFRLKCLEDEGVLVLV